jgi:hypothetical protein
MPIGSGPVVSYGPDAGALNHHVEAVGVPRVRWIVARVGRADLAALAKTCLRGAVREWALNPPDRSDAATGRQRSRSRVELAQDTLVAPKEASEAAKASAKAAKAANEQARLDSIEQTRPHVYAEVIPA